jgi:hypothetical protein
VSTIELTSTFTNPEHVSGAIVPASSSGILTGKGLLVWEQKALVGCEKVGLGEISAASVNTTGLHETKGLVDLVCELAVSFE